jgi:hypothetical protein
MLEGRDGWVMGDLLCDEFILSWQDKLIGLTQQRVKRLLWRFLYGCHLDGTIEG